MSARVTVVTPSFNHGHFIRTTIESVLAQDYPDIEYIIMDGGSTDSTESVVREYGSRLQFISERDRGQSHAINKGFRQASGSIVSWLNSDDIYLPGAVRLAVEAFSSSPSAGAVYGEGYLLDREGRITGPFPYTQPMNLWRLVHLSDFILQQTLFIRKAALDEVGYLNEDLHYTMDWDILIRLAKRYEMVYVPQAMGAIREYGETKTASGGRKRVAEIRRLLQFHTGRRMPPGYIVYGVDAYQQMLRRGIAKLLPAPIHQALSVSIERTCGQWIGSTLRRSQGWLPDGWAMPRLEHMLPPGKGGLRVHGHLPDIRPWLHGQTLTVRANGRMLGAYPLPFGDFTLEVPVPDCLEGETLHLELKATRFIIPNVLSVNTSMDRLSYKLKGIHRVPLPPAAG